MLPGAGEEGALWIRGARREPFQPPSPRFQVCFQQLQLQRARQVRRRRANPPPFWRGTRHPLHSTSPVVDPRTALLWATETISSYFPSFSKIHATHGIWLSTIEDLGTYLGAGKADWPSHTACGSKTPLVLSAVALIILEHLLLTCKHQAKLRGENRNRTPR